MSEVTINYKGSPVATMDASGLKTLLTQGKYLEDDVEIVYQRPSQSAPNLQTKNKTYTPTESQQTEQVRADSGYDGLDEVNVTVQPVSASYVGSGVDRRDSTDLTQNGATVGVPAGYYEQPAAKTIPNATRSNAITVGNDGLITNTHNILTEGYLPAGSQQYTRQLTTQGAQTIHPSTQDQTIQSGRYLTGAQTIKAVQLTNLLASIIKKDEVVKIGDDTDDDCVASITGTYEASGGGSNFPTFTVVYDNSNNITSVTCDKTYSECVALTGANESSATLKLDETAVYGDPTIISYSGMCGTQNWNISGYPVEYVAVTVEGVPFFQVNIFSDESITYSFSPKTLATLNVTQNQTYNAPWGKLYDQVVVSIPSAASTIAKKTKYNSDATATSLVFTGIEGAPRAFFLRYTGTLSRSTSYRHYYVVTMRYDGTNVNGNRWYRYSGEYSNVPSGYSYTYSDGTLTLTSSGTQTSGSGAFYNGTYELVYVY